MLWEGVGISNKPSTVILQDYQKQPARLAGHLLLFSKFENLSLSAAATAAVQRKKDLPVNCPSSWGCCNWYSGLSDIAHKDNFFAYGRADTLHHGVQASSSASSKVQSLVIYLYHHTSSAATLKMTHFTAWVDHCTPGTDWHSSVSYQLAGALLSKSVYQQLTPRTSRHAQLSCFIWGMGKPRSSDCIQQTLLWPD